MNQTHACPRCGRINPSVNSFCAGCGADLSPSKGNAWKAFLGALVLFAGIAWGAAFYTRTTPPAPPGAQSHPQPLVNSGASADPASQPLSLTSAQHLNEGKRALADGYKPNKDPKKTAWGEVAAAKWHLKAISPGAAEYREAQGLLKEVARRERQIELAARPAAATTAAEDVETAAAAGEEDDPSTGSPTAAPPSSPAPAGKGRASSSAGGATSGDSYTNSEGVRVRRPTFSEGGPPEGATAQCRDGSYSFSRNRRGTCSHHGGVARWL